MGEKSSGGGIYKDTPLRENWRIPAIDLDKKKEKQQEPTFRYFQDDDLAPESLGSYLRDKRNSRNISLEEVSKATGISTTVLQALETNERDKLPAEVYIMAFYKKYAQYLGLDSDIIQAKFQQKSRELPTTDKTSSFATVITIKGQEENIFTETLRRLFLPVVIILSGLLVYWIYKKYLIPYIPFNFF